MDNIRAEMARRRVSQRHMAEQLGISQAAFSYRMSGKTPLDINELDTIAKTLGVPVESLVKDAA